MRRSILLLCVVGFLVAADDAKDKAAKDELKKFDGAWKAVMAKVDGREATAEELAKVHVTVEAGQYTVKIDDQVVEKGNFTMDPSKKPKQMDVKPVEGQNQGKTLLAIYELNADDLKICFTESGKDRPDDFSSDKDSNRVLHVYKRAKAK
jgi:uncharacterized protein (TIGR03067 family)